MKSYCTTLDVKPPPLSLDDLEVWEESEKKRSKQLSVLSPLRGLKDARYGVCVCVRCVDARCAGMCMYTQWCHFYNYWEEG